MKPFLCFCLLFLFRPAIAASDLQARNEAHLQELSEAELKWKQAAIANYSYSLYFGGGLRYEEDVFKVSVRGDRCKAIRRPYGTERNRMWNSVPCEGLRIANLFDSVRINPTLEGVHVSARFHPKYGYILNAGGASEGMEDGDWSVTVKHFRYKGN
jgi:hypothetical protein